MAVAVVDGGGDEDKVLAMVESIFNELATSDLSMRTAAAADGESSENSSNGGGGGGRRRR